MGTTYNIYCDESCHLENDGLSAMAMGAIWVPMDKTREISERLREIKKRHKLGGGFELKWSKISSAKLSYYLDCVDYFFDDDDLHFRGVVVPDKTLLQHSEYNQSHDEWYYKMYFNLLKTIFAPGSGYRVYIDFKDTLGHEKTTKLHEILCSNQYDFSRQMIERVKRVRSEEVEQLQLADLFIGALTYLHRGLDKNKAKSHIIERIKKRSGYSLRKTTLSREDKFNLLVWQGGGNA